MVHNFLKKIVSKLENRPRAEKKVTYGKDNPDQTFYVIRLVNGGGLFSYIINGIGRIEYAIEKGYTPVIDMQNYVNPYLGKGTKNMNAWELFFEQPKGYSLNDITKSKNVILSDSSIIENRPRATMDCLSNVNGIMDFWRDVTNKFLLPKIEVMKYVDSEYNRLIHSEDRVLGVICRGTDYVSMRPKGHWIQPDISDVINKAHSVMLEFNCNKIFLATEDKSIMDVFVCEFGEDVVKYNDKKWIDYKSGYINDYSNERNNDEYLKGLEYFTTIKILSKCNCLIGGRAGGTVGAMMMRNTEYEYTYFWDLGVY